MCKVINIKQAPPDWEANSEYVYIGRKGHGQDGYFGNPYKLNPGDKRGSTIDSYRVYFKHKLTNDTEFKRRVDNLKNKTLVCFCKPNACHGDVIAEYLNQDDK